jgi:hypothetical protein
MEVLTENEIARENEHSLNWQDADESHEACVIMSHAAAFKTKDFDTLKRIFNLGNPDIIFGDKLSYCRVAKQSVQLMTILTKQYLKH